jgi:hypothetical protein
MLTIKGKYSPDNVNVSKLKVFISYKTEEWAFASQIYEILKSMGFKVFIAKLETGLRKLIPKNHLQSMLSKEVNESDYICIITSDKSIKSEWIQFEFKEAAEVIGRIVFVCNNYQGISHPGDIFMSNISPGEFSSLITIKHTTLMFSDVTKENVKTLAIEMMNDPDEFWANGIFFSGLQLDICDLKKESMRKKYARKMVLNDPQFIGIRILDVIPFDWEEAECNQGEVEKARMWIVFDFGRKNLAKGISDGNVEARYVSYTKKGNSKINAFVVIPIV